jgi:uncharacterized protein
VRIRNLGFAVGLALAATGAWAGAAEDYKAGVEAYRLGDVRNAVSILRKSADAGHAPSQALLGEILDMADQNDEAVKYFRLAAGQGSPAGIYGLAMMYATGEGVTRDLAVARDWMTKAAQAGHPRAVQALALSYMHGGLALTDAERASPEALRWIEAAAGLDSLPAIDRLAMAYRQGELGVQPDVKKAEALEARAKVLRNVGNAPKTKSRGKPVPKANG